MAVNKSLSGERSGSERARSYYHLLALVLVLVLVLVLALVLALLHLH